MSPQDRQTIDRAIATAKRVVRNVAPDFCDQPLYIIEPAPGTMLTPEMLGAAGGLYTRGLAEMLRPQLESQGRWRGPGVAIVVDAEAYFTAAGNEDDFVRYVAGVVLHEVAHWIDRLDVDVPLEPPQVRYESFVRRCEARAAVAVAGPPTPNGVFLEHGSSFTRICAHMVHRSRQIGGLPLRPVHLCFANHYPGLEMLPSPEAFIDALQSELELCEGMPLAAIAKLPPATEFDRLWSAAWDAALSFTADNAA
jgi:hypothetical protein